MEQTSTSTIGKVQNNAKSIILESYYEELNEHKFFGIIISKTINIAGEKLRLKIIDIIKTINSPIINYQNLKNLIFDGLPDDIPSLRSLVWKIILKFIPDNVNNWEQTIDERRNEYNMLKKKIYNKLELDKLKHKGESNSVEVLDYSGNNNNKKSTTIKKRNTVDHPLAMAEDSKWKNYFNDLELLEEVEKDVRRTRTNMHFFFIPSRQNTNLITNDEITDLADKKRNDPRSLAQEKLLHKANFETNADVMTRMLFIYGKKYPEVRYIQGMNEILAPIYYAFSSDQNPYFYLNLEPDAFICFENLMKEIRDIFIRSKDNTDTGIQTRMKNLNYILKLYDKELFQHFQDQKVEIQFFAFRWYTLFLTQEFEMPDILRLWDSILAEDEKFEFLNVLCIAIVKMKRHEIMQSDFAGIMMTLQTLDKIDVEKLIKVADVIRNELYKNL